MDAPAAATVEEVDVKARPESDPAARRLLPPDVVSTDDDRRDTVMVLYTDAALDSRMLWDALCIDEAEATSDTTDVPPPRENDDDDAVNVVDVRENVTLVAAPVTTTLLPPVAETVALLKVTEAADRVRSALMFVSTPIMVVDAAAVRTMLLAAPPNRTFATDAVIELEPMKDTARLLPVDVTSTLHPLVPEATTPTALRVTATDDDVVPN